MPRENIAEYRLSWQLTTGYFDDRLSSIATGERVASFLNFDFVPVDLETTIMLKDRFYRTFSISVVKLHLFQKEINDNGTVEQ